MDFVCQERERKVSREIEEAAAFIELPFFFLHEPNDEWLAGC
jgi:hypothetical protein